MKQNKGRGIIVLDRSKNTEKYLNIPQTEQFTKLRHDPTKYWKQDTTGIKEIEKKINNKSINSYIP